MSGQGFVAAGTSLVSRSGSAVSVSDVAWEKADGGYTVYNFSVEADHSYFVRQEADCGYMYSCENLC